MEAVVCVFGSIVLASLTEYGLHRWVLHDELFRDVQHAHRVEHHLMGMMDPRHTRYTWGQALLMFCATTPIFAPAMLYTWWALSWPAVIIWWKYAHEAVHRSTHGQRAWRPLAWALCPWWPWCSTHHARHHDEPGRNYSNLFPWTDLVFGTYLL